MVSDYFIYNSHITVENSELFWQINTHPTKLDYFPKPLSELQLLNYVQLAFGLEQGPLYRFALIKENTYHYRLIIVNHHLLIDGLSGNEAFYQANVQATINLLDLANLTQGQDFNYISTLAIFVEDYVPEHNYYIFTEQDNADILKNRHNLYLLTKYEAEQEVIKARQHGLNTKVYRVGNLVMHSQNYKIQYIYCRK